ncbi:DUF3473 domain-containing protein [Candidatus Woesearchaeota archaeon]|nr:DUF3473 domain-containing protein [Candidatus Woesearchaeota archaeon]
MKITNALTFDLEDWFQVQNLRMRIPIHQWDNYTLRVEQSTHEILDLLDQHNTKATFFVVGWVAERKPQLIKEIHQRGHEIASHGYHHQSLFELTPKEFKEDIKRSLLLLQKITGTPVIGYRAPNYSLTPETLWAVDELIAQGIKYDCSVLPMYKPYASFRESYRYPYLIKKTLIEFPVSFTRIGLINIPLGGAYFRILPLWVSKQIINTTNKKGHAAVFYLHPWEVDHGQPRVSMSLWREFRQYTGLAHTKKKLRELLREFTFSSMRGVLHL